MENLKKFVEKNPQLKSENNAGKYITFKGTGAHYLTLVKGEPSTKKNYRTGQPEKGVLLHFLENEQPKEYFTPMYVIDKNGEQKFHYLIEKFADIPEGTELVIQFKQKPGSPQGFLDVKVAPKVKVNGVVQDDIPIIEEESYNINDIIEDGSNQETPDGEFGL